MTIAVVVAHPSDEVIGAGGTIAEYAKKEETYSIILSNGGDSTLLVKPDILANKRKQESEKAVRLQR